MDSHNYFELFNLETSFNVDERDLKLKYYKLNREYHPDFYTLESEEKQQEVLKMSSLVNTAYKTLSDPMSRMKYVLQLEGFVGENEKYELPQSFLMEMMDINEAIFDLQMDYDSKVYDGAIAEIHQFETNLEGNVAESIKAFENKTDTEQALKKIEEYYFKSKYLLRIKENLSTFVRS